MNGYDAMRLFDFVEKARMEGKQWQEIENDVRNMINRF